MLILTRKPGESLYIGDNIKVTIVELKGNQIRVGIDAPSDLRIYREEIYVQILEENRKAAEAPAGQEGDLETLSRAWKGRSGEAKPVGGLGGIRSMKVESSDPKVVLKRKKSKPADE